MHASSILPAYQYNHFFRARPNVPDFPFIPGIVPNINDFNGPREFLDLLVEIVDLIVKEINQNEDLIYTSHSKARKWIPLDPKEFLLFILHGESGSS